MRRAAGLSCLTSLLLGLGCSAASPHPAAVRGFSWRVARYGHHRLCMPVAISASAQARGLMGLKHPFPMAFSFVGSRSNRPAFWMKDTPAPLIGVWVGAVRRRVLGYWHGQPYSLEGHEAPGPLSYVLEFPRPWWSRLPPVGSRVRFGRRCPPGKRL